jgi:acetyltransferase-like isoleucine patch superfamily enzyme
MVSKSAFIHESATVGYPVQIWHHSQVREGVKIGDEVILGKSVYLGPHVEIANSCKVQNMAQIHDCTVLERGVFIGPSVVITNDRIPRAVNRDGIIKKSTDWNSTFTNIGEGASVGAGSIIVSPRVIGSWAMIGAGSVVTRDVLSHALVYGNPAKFVGWVGFGGERLIQVGDSWISPDSNESFTVRSFGLELNV